MGWPLPGTRVRIAADGEILLSRRAGAARLLGPGSGRRRPRGRRTAGCATGDIGALDDEGYLTITGRKKEILITAGGKSVAPAPLENWLRSHPLIAQCMVVGDRRPYVTALITLDTDGVTHWRRMNGKHPVPAELLVDDEELEGDPAARGGRGQQAGLPRRSRSAASRSSRWTSRRRTAISPRR